VQAEIEERVQHRNMNVLPLAEHKYLRMVQQSGGRNSPAHETVLGSTVEPACYRVVPIRVAVVCFRLFLFSRSGWRAR
jgi:hypothetical protein